MDIKDLPTPTETTIEVSFGSSPYQSIFEKSYNDITLNQRISLDVLTMDGMSGGYYRSFINNLIFNLSDAKYLEVGSWAGSTVCSAVENNNCKAICIDNWSEFGGPKDKFIENTNKVIGVNNTITLIESDFRKVDYNALGKSQVYLFDGPHSYQDHYDGITISQPALQDVYIQIVDDWNWPSVRNGTLDAIKNLGIEILESITVRTSQDNEHTKAFCKSEGRWHNGYFIAVLKKPIRL